MRSFIAVPFVCLFAVYGWECPQCSTDNQGNYCTECHLPLTPEGMVFVPSTTVEIDGETVYVSRFFIDARPATYRDILPWLNSSGFTAQDLGSVITGGNAETMEFLAFTPFIGDQGGGITVPSQCLENPAASITWGGAQTYLSERGKRLPTLGELMAANEAGLLEEYDSYDAMLDFSSQLRASLGEMLGTLATQAMFAGYSTARERIMWEMSGSPLDGDPMDRAPAPGITFIRILKPGSTADLSAIHRNDGYFNVIFRGAIEVPE